MIDICFYFNSDSFSNSLEKESSFTNFYQNWLYFIFPLMTIDMFVKTDCGYFKNGLQILDRKAIVIRYFKIEFIYDFMFLISIVLLIVFEGKMLNPYYYFFIKAFFLLKIPILKEIINNLEEIINFDEKMIAFISLMKLFIEMLFLAHIMASIWFCLPNLDHNNNWMKQKGIENASLGDKYQLSLYWAFVTIATIGYGDITPQNHYEYSFTMASVVLGSIFFGYTLNYISIIFEDLGEEKKNKK